MPRQFNVIRFSISGETSSMELEFDGSQEPVVHVHHHYHGRNRGRGGLDKQEVRELMKGFLESLRVKLVPLTDKVTANETLLKDLSARLRTAIEEDDPEQAKAILDSIDANTGNLARAAAENTVAAPTPPSQPIEDDPLTAWDESKGETDPALNQ